MRLALNSAKSLLFLNITKKIRALRGLFGPLWSQKLKVIFHQFLLVDLLEELLKHASVKSWHLFNFYR